MSSKVATVKEAVKEAVVGHRARARALQADQGSLHQARRQGSPRAASCSWALEEFINAVAPPEEDYGSLLTPEGLGDSGLELPD